MKSRHFIGGSPRQSEQCTYLKPPSFFLPLMGRGCLLWLPRDPKRPHLERYRQGPQGGARRRMNRAPCLQLASSSMYLPSAQATETPAALHPGPPQPLSNAPCLPGRHAKTLLWCLSQRANLDTTAYLFANTERKQREGEAGEGNIPAGRAWVPNVSRHTFLTSQLARF